MLSRCVNFCIYSESMCILRRLLQTHCLYLTWSLTQFRPEFCIEILVMRSPWFDWEAFVPRTFEQAVQISDLEAWVGMNLLLSLVHWLIWPSSLLLNRSKKARICKTSSRYLFTLSFGKNTILTSYLHKLRREGDSWGGCLQIAVMRMHKVTYHSIIIQENKEQPGFPAHRGCRHSTCIRLL